MEDSRWLKLMTIGLVLAAVAVGYFLFNSRFASNTEKQQSQADQAVASPSPSSSPNPTATSSPSVLGQNAQAGLRITSGPTPTPASAFNRIVSRNQGNQGSGVTQNSDSQLLTTLPRTGFPIESAIAFSIAAAISGWGLRRFPH